MWNAKVRCKIVNRQLTSCTRLYRLQRCAPDQLLDFRVPGTAVAPYNIERTAAPGLHSGTECGICPATPPPPSRSPALPRSAPEAASDAL